MLELDPYETLELDEQDSITRNSTLTSPKTFTEIPTKAYVDFLSGNYRNRLDIATVIADRDLDVDKNKLTDLDSVSVKRYPNSENELANKKDVDDETNKRLLSDLIKHYKTTRKSLSGTTVKILPNMIENK